MPPHRIFFPRRRHKRRVIIGTGIVVAALIIFAAGFYMGSTYPDLFAFAPQVLAANF